MAVPIQRLTRLASKTFSRFHSADGLQLDRLAQLRSAFNEITASDVNFDSDVIRQRDRESGNTAPVSYIHLWEDEKFTMGIFVVKNGGRLPLHDHPGMFGLLKVIHGTLKIVSLSEMDGAQIPDEINQHIPRWQKPLVKCVHVESEGILTADQECSQLTPSKGNFHEITAESEMAAFMDILAPPYDHSENRDCHYYSEIPLSGTGNASKEVKWIVRVPQPLDFWCDSVDYTGPDLDARDT